MLVCACARACMHACMHTYIHACMHAYIHTYLCTYIYILDLHMTPSGVMLHECEPAAENLHRKLKEYHNMPFRKRAVTTPKTLNNHWFSFVFSRIRRFGEPCASWKHLGSILGRFGGILERLGGILERLGGVLERLGAVLEPSWSVLERLGAVLEPSWSVLEAS